MPFDAAETDRRKFRTVFISDLHLGTRACQADLLLDFIRSIECDTLYLVGDIIDGWKLKSGWHWPQSHNDVVQKLLRMARKGTAIVYLGGNHDRGVLDFCGAHFGGVMVGREAVHETADGRRLLVTHGDAFDQVVAHAGWRAFAGDWGYRALIGANSFSNFLRRRLGLGYWSLAAHVKSKTVHALAFVRRFEDALAGEARRRGLDGVVCGHIHVAAIRDIDGVVYLNDGDWVESCTAVVEHMDGRLELVKWAGRPGAAMSGRAIDIGARPAADTWSVASFDDRCRAVLKEATRAHDPRAGR
jgi:UDP-2,3-diacylglucosamine pyrophosphatase LpxH